jgi:hypothetical protein
LVVVAFNIPFISNLEKALSLPISDFLVYGRSYNFEREPEYHYSTKKFLVQSIYGNAAGLFESSFLPLPTLGKEGKCGDTPHPVKGQQPLETLLRKPWAMLSLTIYW